MPPAQAPQAERGDEHGEPRTEQDDDLEVIETTAAMLRQRPLLPPHPDDPTQDYTDYTSGIAFPRGHCAFSGCRWTDDSAKWELNLDAHVQAAHFTVQPPAATMAFYCAAIRHREQQRMPAAGPSIDRRAFKLLSDVYNDEHTHSLVCFVCTQIKTHTGVKVAGTTWDASQTRSAKAKYTLAKWQASDPEWFASFFSLETFKERYATTAHGETGPFSRAPEQPRLVVPR